MSTETAETTVKRERLPEIEFQPVAVEVEEWQPRKAGGTGPRAPRKRSEYQKTLDSMVQVSYNEQKPQFLEVPADEKAVTVLERQIRKSADYLGYGIRMGEEQPSNRKGHIIMSFIATEKRKINRKKKTDTDAK